MKILPWKAKVNKYSKKSNPEITKEEINKYYDGHIANQLKKSQAAAKPTGHVVAYHVNELWQMDIFDLSRYKLFNKHYQYVLACVDVFWRKAYIQPMLNKDETSVKKSLVKISQEGKP